MPINPIHSKSHYQDTPPPSLAAAKAAYKELQNMLVNTQSPQFIPTGTVDPQAAAQAMKDVQTLQQWCGSNNQQFVQNLNDVYNGLYQYTHSQDDNKLSDNGLWDAQTGMQNAVNSAPSALTQLRK